MAVKFQVRREYGKATTGYSIRKEVKGDYIRIKHTFAGRKSEWQRKVYETVKVIHV